jgi:hypothetical protein
MFKHFAEISENLEKTVIKIVEALEILNTSPELREELMRELSQLKQKSQVGSEHLPGGAATGE